MDIPEFLKKCRKIEKIQLQLKNELHSINNLFASAPLGTPVTPVTYEKVREATRDMLEDLATFQIHAKDFQEEQKRGKNGSSSN